MLVGSVSISKHGDSEADGDQGERQHSKERDRRYGGAEEEAHRLADHLGDEEESDALDEAAEPPQHSSADQGIGAKGFGGKDAGHRATLCAASVGVNGDPLSNPC